MRAVAVVLLALVVAAASANEHSALDAVDVDDLFAFADADDADDNGFRFDQLASESAEDAFDASFVDAADGDVDGDGDGAYYRERGQMTTSKLRRAWSRHCSKVKRTKLKLWNGASLSVATAAAPAFRALDTVMKAYNYPLDAKQTGAYNCRRITGGKGYSLHAYGIAADYNWQHNPWSRCLKSDMPQFMVAAIKAIKTKEGLPVFVWGGDFKGTKDAMHYEIALSPAQMAKGIDESTVATEPRAVPRPKARPKDLGKKKKKNRVTTFVTEKTSGPR